MKRYLAVTALTICLSCSCQQKRMVSNSAPNADTDTVSRGTIPLAGHRPSPVEWVATNNGEDVPMFRFSPTHVEHVLFVTNSLRFPVTSEYYSTVVCVDSNEWVTLTNAYPSNVYHETIEFEKEVTN